MRDPFASDPRPFIAEAGLQPEQIDVRWDSYRSTAPRFVLARARALLTPPPTVELTLEAGAAAEFAIDNIEQDTVGAIELYRRGNGADVRMKFSYALVAVAMIKQRDEAAQTPEAFLKDAFTFLVDAVGHAVSAVQIVTLTELFDKFR